MRRANENGQMDIGANMRLAVTGDLSSSSANPVMMVNGVHGSAAKKLRADALCNPEFQLALYAAAVAQAQPGEPVDAALVSIRSASRTKTLRERLLTLALARVDPQRQHCATAPGRTAGP